MSAHIIGMTTTPATLRPSFTFTATGAGFTLVRNAIDHYAVLDSALNDFTFFSYGGDPEDGLELEAAAIAAVEHKIANP